MMDFIYQYDLHFIFRIIIAGICGIIIGYERKNRAKEAGLRTHCIVACAAAIMMIISKYGFFDLISGDIYPDADIRLDPSRMAQGIVTGVGFLGAGMIYVQKNTVKGLTTSAGIWATSGIGMAIGGGMYIVGIASSFIIVITQMILHKKNRFVQAPTSKIIKLYNVTEDNFQETITEKLREKNVLINDVFISRKEEGGGINYELHLDVPATVSEEALINMTKYKGSIETVR